MRYTLLFILSSFLASCLYSQDNDTLIQSDTIVVDSTVQTTKDDRNTFLDLFKGKPGRAALYATLLPGGGQIYNRKWWKVPLAIGLDGFLLYNVIDSRNDYKKYQDQYRQALIDDDGTAARKKLFRDSARKRYDYARVYLIIGHLVTVVDAYVDRHLMDFDISDDLSVGPRIIPDHQQGFNTGIGLVYTIGK